MTVPQCGHLRLHFHKDAISLFFPLLQKGFYLEIITNNLQNMLCRTCGLDPAAVNDRIQTIFLNGKPVDDTATANVQDGDCLALSAAMPGLVGATMRSGGLLAGLRYAISHQPIDAHPSPQGGVFSIKLFNLLIKEIGPRFLQQGILIGVDDFRNLQTALSTLDWKACQAAELNAQTIHVDTLAAMKWSSGSGFIHLKVTFG